MTIDRKMAKTLGYEIIRASASEVGLIKHGRGVKSWWNSTFDGMPDLGHPKILEAVERYEAFVAEYGNEK